MTRLIDLCQPSILDAVALLPSGWFLNLANVPAGVSVRIHDSRWLEIDDGEDCKITVSVGED